MSCAVLKADTHTSVSHRLAPLFEVSQQLTFVHDASESVEWDKAEDPKFRCATLNKTLSMEGR